MRVVELIGLPGSGKSTIVQAAVEQIGGGGCLEYRDVMLLDRGRTFARAGHVLGLLNMLIRSPGSWFPLARALVSGDGRQRRRLWKYLDLCIRLRRHGDRGEVAVLDQGPIQALASILLEGPAIPAHGARSLFRVAERLWLPDVLCFVDAAPDVAMRRLRDRTNGGSFFDGLDPTDVLTRYRRGAPVLRDLVKLAAASGRVQVARLRAEESPPMNGGIVADLARVPEEASACGSA